MKTYADANVLVRLYLNLPGSDEIAAQLRSAEGQRDWPLPITDLLRFEIVNGIQRMVFESRHGGQWRVTAETAACALSDFEDDFGDRLFLHHSPLVLREIESEVLSLANRYTAKEGFRTYDVMHVASALTLRCKRFLSFDAKAARLAKWVGLETR